MVRFFDHCNLSILLQNRILLLVTTRGHSQNNKRSYRRPLENHGTTKGPRRRMHVHGERKRKKCSHVSGSRCSIGRKNICSHKFAQSFQTFCGQLQFYQNDYRDREKWISFSIFSRNCGFSLSAFSGIVLKKSRILLLQKLLYPRANEKVSELMTLIRQSLKYADKPGNGTRQDE